MKTVIFTQRVEIVPAYNERRDCADQRIAAFIAASGYLPVPVPNNAALVHSLVQALSPCGIILTGGNSLVKYGGNAPERDATDRALIEVSVASAIPLYGFCRGMQSVLDYFRETLVDVKGHVAVRHRLISSLWGNREVNSYHNQACRSLASSEFEMLAETDDGVIEAVRHKTVPIAATMWHPERDSPFASEDVEFVKKIFG